MLASNYDHSVVDYAKIQSVAKRLETHPTDVAANDLIDQRHMAKMYLGPGNRLEEVGGRQGRALAQPGNRFVDISEGFRKVYDAEVHSLTP
jgi:hypothetical protein